MSEITQPPADVQTQDTSTRVSRLSASSDQSASNKQSDEQQTGKNTAELEPEKQLAQHDPAVTLASTLAKLDSGSYFNATVHGTDAEGRTVIASEVGTYLVKLDDQQIEDYKREEFKKIQKDTSLEIKVLTIDKEIKAVIVRPPIDESTNRNPVVLPVTLTLTELGKHTEHSIAQKLSDQAQTSTPLNDIRSQYQATTLYKAERMAREIADKLDNLPLPTSAPNYTVYGSKSLNSTESTAPNLEQISPSVFIQELGNLPPTRTSAETAISQPLLEQILGQNINVQVIKTIPKSPIPLPAGLPEAVIREINALTPIDYVQVGQNLTINVAAIAIPDNMNSAEGVTTITNSQIPDSPASARSSVKTVANPATPTTTENAPSNSVVDSAIKSHGVKDTIISGIIVDTTQKFSANIQTTALTGDAAQQTNTPYNMKNGPGTFTAPANKKNSYYLATPTSVMKFKSNTPLVPGTVVSFTVQPNSSLAQNTEPLSKTDIPASATITTTASASGLSNAPEVSTANTAGDTTNQISQISTELTQKIENFAPQEIEQLPQDWGSIGLALSVLHSSTATNMAAILSSRIPNMLNPQQLTSTMFFFLSALKAPQPARTWLGPEVSSKIKQLGAGKIIDRIDHDFSRIARMGADTPAGEWRPHLIPQQNGPDISAIPMLTKQIVEEDKNRQKKGGNSDNKQKVKATRFILELNFSQLGTLLLDGLLKKKRLDLILKSKDQIPFSIKTKLTERYTEALKKNDFAGEMVIIDNKPADISVIKIIEAMIHKNSVEKKI